MGKDFLIKCLIAVLASFVLMILYITIRFRRIGGLSAGITGVIALFHDVMMVLGTFIVFRLPIDDNFMAVVLFILGYSINDTIVIFDRIRENEKLYGKSLDYPELLNKSVNQTMKRTINTSISTLIAMVSVCVFAVIFRVSNILTFAFPMVVGLVAGSYTPVPDRTHLGFPGRSTGNPKRNNRSLKGLSCAARRGQPFPFWEEKWEPFSLEYPHPAIYPLLTEEAAPPASGGRDRLRGDFYQFRFGAFRQLLCGDAPDSGGGEDKGAVPPPLYLRTGTAAVLLRV